MYRCKLFILCFTYCGLFKLVYFIPSLDISLMWKTTLSSSGKNLKAQARETAPMLF